MEKDDKKLEKAKAGHNEVLGETIAKFEFFQKDWNPYSRYLDVDKVDLILRKRNEKTIKYVEIQVKYGRLFNCNKKWERPLFDVTSWRFFKLNEFADPPGKNLYLAYVLSIPGDYKGDIFVFKADQFHELIQSAVRVNTKKGPMAKMYIAHSKLDDNWYVWKRLNFESINNSTVIDVTKYRRNFDLLN